MHISKSAKSYIICWAFFQQGQKKSTRESLCCLFTFSELLIAPPPPPAPRSGARGCSLPLLEEKSWYWRSPRPAPQFSLRKEKPPPSPPLLHIWLPPERSFGGKTRMFLFPRREEELQSETTELKHREASWALTQPAAQRVRSFSTLPSSFSLSSSRTKYSY